MRSDLDRTSYAMESEPYYNVFRTYTLFDSYQQQSIPGSQLLLQFCSKHLRGWLSHPHLPQFMQHCPAPLTTVNRSDKKSPPYYISKAHDMKRTRSLKTEPRCQANNGADLKKASRVTLKKSSIVKQGGLLCVLRATQACTVDR